MASPSARRRQRSTRLTVAVALLTVAGVLVVASVISGSLLLVTVAAVLAVGLGAAATKITHSELLQSRRDAARDRAEQAKAYKVIEAERVAENQAFARAMTERISERQRLIDDLEGELSAAQRRVAEQTLKMSAEARRADQAELHLSAATKQAEDADERAAEAIVRLAELEQEIDVLRSELDAWVSMVEADRRQRA